MTVHIQLTKRPVKLKDGKRVFYWTLRWIGTNGKWHSESVGKVGDMTKNEAETLRRQKEAAMVTGAIRRDRPRPVTLGEFLKLDFEAIKPDVKLNTLESHKHATAHATAALGEHAKLLSIGALQVAHLKTHLAEKKKVSAATIAKTLRTLKAAFYRALKSGFVHENPFVGVKIPKTQSRPKRLFTADETRAMREVTPNIWWKAFIALAESTGFRKGELLNLMWRDIDFETKTARVAAKRANTFTAPDGSTLPILAWSSKAYEDRSVPLPETTISILTKLLAENDGSPYVFLPIERLRQIGAEMGEGQLGANYELVNNMNRFFDLLQRLARQHLAQERGVALEKLPWPRGTIHDLRRTYGTRMAKLVPIHVLKEYMGHSKIQTTQEFYLAAESGDADKARQALEGLLSGQTSHARNTRAIESSDEKPPTPQKDKPLPEQGLSSEADGTRTRNHRIDSPVL